MKKEDRNTFLLVAIILIVCIVSLVAIFNIVWGLIVDPIKDATAQTTEAFVMLQGEKTADYNFDVPELEADEVPQETTNIDSSNDFNEMSYRQVLNALQSLQTLQNDSIIAQEEVSEEAEEAETSQIEEEVTSENTDQAEPTDVQVDDDMILIEEALAEEEAKQEALAEKLAPKAGETYNYNFVVPASNLPKEDVEVLQSFPDAIVQDAVLAGYGQGEDANTQVNLQIRIPKIGVNSPVVQGLGADNLLEQGFWVHPGSFELGEGEVTMLCHRRFFGPYDPRSCWFLDEISKGDEILLDFYDTTLQYKVVGVNVFDGEDPLIYTFNEEKDYIKIVTCTPLYSNEQRLVVLAERAE